ESDVDAAVERAVGLGAVRSPAFGEHALESPSGFVFCIVHDHGEATRPQPFAAAVGTSLVDQLSIDVPASRMADEVACWTTFTGWERGRTSRPEFQVLVRPPSMPLRLMLQRLGEADGRDAASGHLDVACGDDVPAIAAWHCELGAHIERVETYWTTLRD